MRVIKLKSPEAITSNQEYAIVCNEAEALLIAALVGNITSKSGREAGYVVEQLYTALIETCPELQRSYGMFIFKSSTILKRK